MITFIIALMGFVIATSVCATMLGIIDEQRNIVGTTWVDADGYRTVIESIDRGHDHVIFYWIMDDGSIGDIRRSMDREAFMRRFTKEGE